MQIKSYNCTQFGGLKNKTIDLKQGLNVILGPNEAGKSTMVEGIYSTIFKQHKLKNSLSADKEFQKRFMPKPSGDFIDGNLAINIGNEKYQLAKSWGSSAQTRMTLPDGSVIQDEKLVDQQLSKILKFGEKTYANIIFSKQEDLKKSISIILSEKDATNDVSSILRKVIMELDGISIDKLKTTLEKEYKKLFDRWDPENECPANLNQRYTKGLGEIIENYYLIEDKQEKISLCQTIEEQLNQVSQELKETEGQTKHIREKIKVYSDLEQDIIKRASLEPEVKNLMEKEKELSKISAQWPAQQERYKNLQKELEQTQEILEELTIQGKQASKLKEKERLEIQLKKVNVNKAEIKSLQKTLSEIPHITKQDIKNLEVLRSKVQIAETSIKAGKMTGKIVVNKGSDLWITKDFDDKEPLANEQTFTANGYLKIEVEDHIAIEIQSGEFDFQQLKVELNTAQLQLKQKLENSHIASIEEGKLNLEKIDKYAREIESLNREISSILDGKSYEELQKEKGELDQIQVKKAMEDIEEELKKNRTKESDLKTQCYSLNEKLEQWLEEYQDHSNLFKIAVENMGKLAYLKEQLEQLAPLPEEFSSNSDFSQNLSNLRNNLQEHQDNYRKAKDKYYDLEKEMPESSTEEMTAELNTIQGDFEKILQKGRTLLKVKAVFERKLEAMDQNTFDPLIKAFSKYLTTLTLDSYNTADIDDDFNLEIQKGNVPMPLELLSTGTKDCVALALRLAIIEVLYEQKPGIIVLDDCLVDLDPQRKEKAVELIQQFAELHQVIFTTCNPHTAQELGGNIISL